MHEIKRAGNSESKVTLCLNRKCTTSPFHCPGLFVRCQWGYFSSGVKSHGKRREGGKHHLDVNHGSEPIVSFYMLQETLHQRQGQGYLWLMTSFGFPLDILFALLEFRSQLFWAGHYEFRLPLKLQGMLCFIMKPFLDGVSPSGRSWLDPLKIHAGITLLGFQKYSIHPSDGRFGNVFCVHHQVSRGLVPH